MTTVAISAPPDNAARHDDARLELVYRAVCDLFELPESPPFDLTTLDAELLPIDAPRLPCGCGCGSSLVRRDEAARGWCLGCPGPEERVAGDNEDRSRRDTRDARPNAAEEAYWAGFCLGREGVEADAPSGYSGFERSAFLTGLDRGWRARENAERLAWARKFDRDMQRLMMADQDIESRYTDMELADANIGRIGGAL